MILRPITIAQSLTFIPNVEVADDTAAVINLTRSGTEDTDAYNVTLTNDREFTTASTIFDVKESFEYDIEVLVEDSIIYSDALFVTAQEAEDYKTNTEAVEHTTDNTFNFPTDE